MRHNTPCIIVHIYGITIDVSLFVLFVGSVIVVCGWVRSADVRCIGGPLFLYIMLVFIL